MVNEEKNRNNTEINKSEQAKTDKRDEYPSISGNITFVCFHLKGPDERAWESTNINMNKSFFVCDVLFSSFFLLF